MRLGSQQYVNLIEHSYDRNGDMKQFVDKVVEVEGTTYKVLDFVDSHRTGYQGTIYQHVESGEIVVAHRGTEFERQRFDDLIKTDGAMVLTRVNLQADDAIALAGRAREISREVGVRTRHAPEVTVTGHSLGGTLAQISAHYYDLRDEERTMTTHAPSVAPLALRVGHPARRDRRIMCLLVLSILSPTAFGGAMNSQSSPSFMPNPEPRQAYTLTVRIQDAPGPLEVVASAAQYDVVNTECLPPPKDDPEGFTAPVPTHDLPIALQRISDTEYRGTFYVDGMLDRDLHGRGVCHWALIQAQVQLKATGAAGGTRFIAKIGGDELEHPSSNTKAFHYWKARYPTEAGHDDYPDYGQRDLQQVPADRRDDFFEVLLTAKGA